LGSVLNPNAYPTLLFNAMVNPLIPFAMQGVYGTRANQIQAGLSNTRSLSVNDTGLAPHWAREIFLFTLFSWPALMQRQHRKEARLPMGGVTRSANADFIAA
jgi:hypothetical protein